MDQFLTLQPIRTYNNTSQPHLVGCVEVPAGMKQQEIRRKQGEKDKEIENEEAENTRKTGTILWLSLGAILTIKLGMFKDV